MQLNIMKLKKMQLTLGNIYISHKLCVQMANDRERKLTNLSKRNEFITRATTVVDKRNEFITRATIVVDGSP